MARRSAQSQQNDQQHSTARLTEGYHIENLDRFVDSCRRKTAPIGTDTRTADFARVGSELLYELNAIGHLLPELDYTIDRAGDDKVGDRSDGHERQLLLVHEGLRVSRRDRQRIDVDLLEG